MTKDDVLRKVQALLNMTAERGATDAEAEVAVSKAQALLSEYNLSVSEVKTENGNGAEPVVKTKENYAVRRFTGNWQGSLAVAVSKANFCRCIGSHDGVWFVGTETNARVAADVWRYLVQQIQMACIASYQEAWRDETPARFQKQCVWGAVSRLAERLREAKRESAGKRPEWFSGTDAIYRDRYAVMVIANDNRVNDYIRSEWPHLGRASSHIQKYGPGYNLGVNAANGMSLGNSGRITGGNALIGR